MKHFDITEKIGCTSSRAQKSPSLFCFGNYKSKSVFLNTLKLGTSTLKDYAKKDKHFWYVNVELNKNDVKINNIIDELQYSKHQVSHIKKILLDTLTTFYFIMKDPDELFLSSFIYCIDQNYDHQIHTRYYIDTDEFENNVSSFFDMGKNTKPNLLIGYFNELIDKFPKKLFDDGHFLPKYIQYTNFLHLFIDNYNKNISNFKLLQIDDIPDAIKKDFDFNLIEPIHSNKMNTTTKHEFYSRIMPEIDFKKDSVSSINDIFISTCYNQDVSVYKLIKTLIPTVKFDDSEKTDTEDILVDNNDKKDS